MPLTLKERELQEELRAKENAAANAREHMDVQFVLSRAEGRRFLRRLFGPGFANIYGRSVDPHALGKRAVGLDLRDCLNAAQEGAYNYLALTKEQDEGR